MDPRETSKILQKIYFWQLIPAAILVAIAYLLNYYFDLTDMNITSGKTVMIVITTLSGVMGIAVPVFYRSFFVYKIRDKKQISADTFLSFERVLLSTALLTPYFLAISVLLNMNQTALMLIALFSIYVAYYYFPSRKKVLFEMKIFRIKPITKQEK